MGGRNVFDRLPRTKDQGQFDLGRLPGYGPGPGSGRPYEPPEMPRQLSGYYGQQGLPGECFSSIMQRRPQQRAGLPKLPER